MISIDIVSDTVCPWCFIGKRRLERAIEQRPDNRYRLGWRPFQLNPEMPADGMEREQYLSLKFGGRERADSIYQQVLQAGKKEGLGFRFDAIPRQPNTFDSHRLIRWAADAELQDAVVEQLFQRYFFEGADVGDRDVLIDIADRCGMDIDDVRDRYDRDVDVMLVRDEEMTARRMGITGVPCFVVNRKYAVSGAQDPSVLVHVFDLTTGDADGDMDTDTDTDTDTGDQAAEDAVEA